MKEIADGRGRRRRRVEHVSCGPGSGRPTPVERAAATSRWDELLAGAARTFETEALDSEHPAVHRLHQRARPGRPKGVRPRPRRVPGEDRRGGRVPGGPAPGRGPVLGHRPRLDHGAVGDRRRARAGRDRAAHRRRAEPSRARSALGHGRAPPHHDARRLAHPDPRADPARRRARSRARPLVACGSSASTGEPWNPEPYRWCSEEVGGGRCPIINISGGTEVGACFLSPLPITDLKPCTLRGPALGMDVDVWGSDGNTGPAGRGRGARLHKAVARHDARHLGRRRALPGDLLAAVPGRLGARRLGEHRRGRLLVPPRPLRRHAEHRRQAAGPGRGRERAGVASRRGRVRRGRRPARGQGRGDLVLRRPEARRRARPSRSPRSSVRWWPSISASRSRPRACVFVDELPKTRSAKIVRRAIRAAATGEDPGDLSSLENPGAVDGIRAVVIAG